MGSYNIEKTDFQRFRRLIQYCIIIIFEIFVKQNTDLSKNKYYYVLNPSGIIFSKLNRKIFVPREIILQYYTNTYKYVTYIESVSFCVRHKTPQNVKKRSLLVIIQ